MLNLPQQSPPLSGLQPPVGHPVHLLLGHAVAGDHVSAHVTLHGKLHLADGTARLAGMLLHVFGQSAPVAVADAADRAANIAGLSWEQEKAELRHNVR